MMKLYYKPGACSMAAHIVLHELGLTFSLERTDTDRGVTETGKDFGLINPNGYVPALEIEAGAVLTENSAILEYLADLTPATHLAPPPGTFQRVRLREILAFLSSELHKSFSPFFTGSDLGPEARQAAQDNIAKRITHIETRLQDTGAYLLGDQFSVADAYAFVILNWSQFIGFSLDKWPLTQGFQQQIRSRPSVVSVLEREGLQTAEPSL